MHTTSLFSISESPTFSIHPGSLGRLRHKVVHVDQTWASPSLLRCLASNSHLVDSSIYWTKQYKEAKPGFTQWITLWWTNSLPWKDPPFLMGKSTISMIIFNCYVSSPVDYIITKSRKNTLIETSLIASETPLRIMMVSWRPTTSSCKPQLLCPVDTYGCVWKCCVPHCTQWFCWSLSLWKMAISLGIYPIFRQTHILVDVREFLGLLNNAIPQNHIILQSPYLPHKNRII